MEQRQWLHLLSARRGTALESTRGSRDGDLVPPSHPGQSRSDQYASTSGGSGRREMEKCHEAGGLARFDSPLLSACQPVWAFYSGSERTPPVVTDNNHIKNCAALIYFAARGGLP